MRVKSKIIFCSNDLLVTLGGFFTVCALFCLSPSEKKEQVGEEKGMQRRRKLHENAYKLVLKLTFTQRDFGRYPARNGA